MQFPRWGSSGAQWSWQPRLRDRKLWAVPPRGHTHSFHNSYERRSLLTGISHVEPSRREIRSENHTRPGQNGATSSRQTPSRRTRSRTPGSREIGGTVYRRSLGQVCTMASRLSGAGWVREYQRGHCNVFWVAKRYTWAWPKKPPNLLHHLGVKHQFPGPRPLPRQDVCSHIEMPRNMHQKKTHKTEFTSRRRDEWNKLWITLEKKNAAAWSSGDY